MVDEKSLLESASRALRVPVPSDEVIASIYAPIVRWVESTRKRGGTFVLGVNGAQGSGKSTFCELAKVLLSSRGLSVAVLSIADLYLTREQRLKLSQEVHPLCAIRGVPGTHDVDLGLSVLNELRALKAGASFRVPRFDKARDDRADESAFTVVTGPVDVVLFEGWCVGEPPLPPFEGAINDREARDDPDGQWCLWSRGFLNDSYQRLYQQLDALMMIKVPSMETVRQSRWLQEEKLRMKMKHAGEADALPGLMTRKEVFEYVDLFERHTLHMFEQMPSRCNFVVYRDEDFNFRISWS